MKEGDQLEPDPADRLKMQHGMPSSSQGSPPMGQQPFVPPFPIQETPLTSRQMPPPDAFPFQPFHDVPMDPNWMNQLANPMIFFNFMSGMQEHVAPSWTGTPSSMGSTPSLGSSGMNDSGLGLSPDENTPPKGNDELSKVQGRLTLNNNSRQYPVTAEEIKRRIGYPEYMTSSTVAALMRKAKTKDGGPQMRRELEKSGITINQTGRKKGVHQPTSFSALLEAESAVLGKELSELVQTFYPRELYADRVIKTALAQGMDINQLREIAAGTANLLKLLGEVANTVNVPFANFNYPENHQDPLYRANEQFSNLTHGFGQVNHKTWIHAFQQLAGNIVENIHMHNSVGSMI